MFAHIIISSHAPTPCRIYHIRRFCYLIDNYLSVFQEDLSRDQQLIQCVRPFTTSSPLSYIVGN